MLKAEIVVDLSNEIVLLSETNEQMIKLVLNKNRHLEP